MNEYEHAANVSVGRAVMFAGLAITMVMLGTAFDFALSLRMGAIATLLMSAVLIWFSIAIGDWKPESTESFLLLAEANRPKSEPARIVFKQTLRDTYRFYAYRSWVISMGMFAASMALVLTGTKIGIV